MKTAVVNLSIKPGNLFVVASSIHKAYAKKHGMDFISIDREKYRIRPNKIRKRRVGIHLEKFQIFEILEHYDRIIYLDLDILIKKDCPNLLEIVPPGEWGCCLENESPEAWKWKEEIGKMEARFGKITTSPIRYFNAGVLVVDKAHRDMFKIEKKEVLAGRWPDQTLLNYRLLNSGYRMCCMDKGFNYLPYETGFDQFESRRKASMVHYAGKNAKEFMRKDLPFYLGEWGCDQ